MHFLAADYDTDIDHELDEMRFHRSRVNFVNKVTPIGIDAKLEIKTELAGEVFLPFDDGQASVSYENDICRINLPEATSYAIIRFKK